MSDWPTVPLGTLLTDIQPGFASGRHNSEGEGIPHFRPMNVSTDGQIERAVMKYVEPSAARPDIRLSRGDILFNNTNSPELVGKTALFEDDDSPAFSNHMTRLRVDSKRLDAKYAALQLHQAWREGWFAAHCNNHVSQASISREVLKEFEIELPPLNVQQAIASLSAALDNSRISASSHLLTARAAIVRFRQAVLAAACSGRLTADWRAERDIKDATDMPGGWESLTLGTVADSIRGGSTAVPRNEPTNYPILRSSSVRPFSIDFSDVRYLSAEQSMREANYLQDGDLLITRLSGSLEYVGNCGIVRLADGARIQYPDRLFCCRLNEPREAQFVELAFAGPEIRSQIEAATRSAAGHQRISISDLKGFHFAHPPLDEQAQIVSRVQQLLQLADGLRGRIDAASTLVDCSSQAVLAKAFRGELMAQETN